MSAEEYLIALRRNSARNAAELSDLRAWWQRQMVTSPTPLRERLTLHWHGHFTSATGKVTGFAQAFYQQNETWRKCALGNFRQFLEAVTHDPGMMAYLDLEQSNREHPNENYARELLELFTLGVGHYTEKDILETARALSGWVLAEPPGTVVAKRPTAPDRLQFPSITREGMVPRFVPGRHDAGEKTILGQTGRFGLKEVLDLIVAQPACGRHVAGRLIESFGASDPDGSLRERMAAAFRESRTEIRPMLRVLFTAPEFYAVRGDHVKSPVRLLVGAGRDLKLEGEVTPALAQLTAPLGQELFNPPTVKGWPDGPAWISASTLALGYRLAEGLLDGRGLTGTEPLGRPRLQPLARDKPRADATIQRLLQIDEERREQTDHDGIKVRLDPAKLLPPGAADDPARLAELILERLVVAPVRAATRAAIIDACQAVSSAERPALAARLILASPEYQVE
jgi:uncharacterized protein (DUF1800 family)